MVEINGCQIGNGNPVYIIAEIGINHNGSLHIARQLIDIAVDTGCNAVKFQKRTPELCVPTSQRELPRETPWGVMTYMEYRKRVEFGLAEYSYIDEYCKKVGITWFASCWDKKSVDFMEQFNPPCYKIASACLTNDELLKYTDSKGKPIILSTGMSTKEQIEHAIRVLHPDWLMIAHCTSTYPAKNEELNLRTIQNLGKLPYPIGYSGHERGLQTTVAAVALGATFIERHITLDHSMWGSDQAASVEPQGLKQLVRDIRIIEVAMGDGVKRVYESEKLIMKRLQG